MESCWAGRATPISHGGWTVKGGLQRVWDVQQVRLTHGQATAQALVLSTHCQPSYGARPAGVSLSMVDNTATACTQLSACPLAAH
jgi:hypothetical protein